MNLFAYGSLILPEVWEAVTGKTHRSEPGVIRGYVRRRVSGATFPGILRTGDNLDRVSGAIYHEIDADSLAALDEFESDFYLRQSVDAAADDGRVLRCQAYVVPVENSHLLSEEPWDLDRFTTDHLEEFLARNFLE